MVSFAFKLDVEQYIRCSKVVQQQRNKNLYVSRLFPDVQGVL